MSKVQKCNFCGISSKDVSNEVFISDDELVRHYEICPKCLSEVFRRIVSMFMDDDDYKVNNIVNEVMDEMYCDVIHSNKKADVEFTSENANIYEVKRK